MPVYETQTFPARGRYALKFVLLQDIVIPGALRLMPAGRPSKYRDEYVGTSLIKSLLFWCCRRDSNPQSVEERRSQIACVYQFRHGSIMG